jgi:hypothetical protein
MTQMTYEVRSVEDQKAAGEGRNWIISTVKSDGSSHTFTFPHISWMAKVAEYGFDLDDIDTILDVCLHEVFGGIDQNHPDFVYNNPEDHARAALLSRVTDIKQSHLVTDPNNFLQKIKTHHEQAPYTAFHQMHRERVRTYRKARVS